MLTQQKLKCRLLKDGFQTLSPKNQDGESGAVFEEGISNNFYLSFILLFIFVRTKNSGTMEVCRKKGSSVDLFFLV